MKFLLLSAAALIASTALSTAQDFSRPAAAVAPSMINYAFSWTGFYVGVHGAWIRDDGDAVLTGLRGVSPATIPPRASFSDNGFGGGGQVGYLMQFGGLVAGLEADLTLTDVGRARSSVSAPGADPSCLCTISTDLSSEMDWFGTVKGRVGVAMPGFGGFFENSLLYLTGGLAYAQIEHRAQMTVTPPGLSLQAGSDSVKMGFTLGGGTEIALTPNVSIKTETLYYNLEDETLVLQRAGDFAAYRFDNDGWLSRVGVNVRF
jgi:outer membrane immunogenic protein